MRQFILFLSLWSVFLSARTPSKVDVVIVGAGLSGLATAYELKKHGVSYHILEIMPRVGGRVRTVRYDRPGEPPLYADSGMEEYWESNPAVKILKELKLPTRNDIAISSIVLGGKLVELGDENQKEFHGRIFTEQERKSLKSFKDKVAPLIATLKSSGLSTNLMKLKDVPFSTWVVEQNLAPKAAEWIRVSVECEIGTSWERISALDGLSEFHIFLGEGERAYRVLGGNDRFTNGMAKAVGLKNISLNKRVNRISTEGEKVTVSYLDTQTNRNGVIVGRHVVSTIPLFRLFEVQFEPALSELKQKAIAAQSWGSYFKAHVFVPRSAEKFWIKDGNSILPILSDSELGVIYDGNPDQKGTRIVSLLVTGDFAERYNLMPLDNVRIELLQAFDKLWPGFSKVVKEIEFYRYHPRAIASWPVGRSRYDDLSQAIRKPDNRVYLAGDFTESSHSDGAFISAKRSVDQILLVDKHDRYSDSKRKITQELTGEKGSQ